MAQAILRDGKQNQKCCFLEHYAVELKQMIVMQLVMCSVTCLKLKSVNFFVNLFKMERKLSIVYYSPKGYWKGFFAVKKMAN